MAATKEGPSAVYRVRTLPQQGRALAWLLIFPGVIPIAAVLTGGAWAGASLFVVACGLLVAIPLALVEIVALSIVGAERVEFRTRLRRTAVALADISEVESYFQQDEDGKKWVLHVRHTGGALWLNHFPNS